MRVSDLEAPQELVDAWKRDLTDLTAVQTAAAEAGILTGRRNMLVVAPTSSGKTLIGEMAAAQIAMTGQRHVFVSVPMKSLAEEHYFRLRERYGDLMNVVISTGDKLEHDEDIRHGYFDLAVLTYEKLAALIVQVPGLLTRCGCVVIDEGQMIADKQRGTDLEVLVTEILLAPSKPRLIVLSASLDELNRLDKWLNAQVVMNSERPVPLNQAVCSAQSGIALVLKANGERVQAEMAEPCADTEMLAVRLALKHAEAGRQVVVFRTAVSKTRSMAHMLAGQRTARGVRVSLNELLLALEDADVVKELADLFASGVAFHNADLSADERRGADSRFDDYARHGCEYACGRGYRCGCGATGSGSGWQLETGANCGRGVSQLRRPRRAAESSDRRPRDSACSRRFAPSSTIPALPAGSCRTHREPDSEGAVTRSCVPAACGPGCKK